MPPDARVIKREACIATLLARFGKWTWPPTDADYYPLAQSSDQTLGTKIIAIG